MFRLSKKHVNKIVLFNRSVNTVSHQEVSQTESKLKDFKTIPGPKCYPVVGSLYMYLPWIGEYTAKTLDKNAWLNWNRYGPLVREEMFQGIRLLHVFDPDDIEAVFRQDGKLPQRRSHLAMREYRMSRPHVYNTGGLLSSNGPEWWNIRSAFQKNFSHPQSVKKHIEATDGIVREFVQWIEREKVGPNDDLLPRLNRLNLEVIGKIAFNTKFNSFSPSEQSSSSRSSKLIKAAFYSNAGIMELDKSVMWRLIRTPKYHSLAKAQRYLEDVSQEILLERSNYYATKESESMATDSCLLDSFLAQPNVDLKDVLGMMVDILMAAVDTTAYTTSFAMYHLGRNLEVQEKLFEEVSRLLPDEEQPITSDILTEAHYVRSCVKETLRINPVSIGIGRFLTKDIVLRGYLIPKETVIVTQNMVASRLPQNVKDPMQFRPERYLRGSEYFESMHPFMSLPFGFGPRTCIARRLAEQNMSIALMRIIRHFKVQYTGEDLGVETHTINKPDKPVTITFQAR